jgi:hypothetical protein
MTDSTPHSEGASAGSGSSSYAAPSLECDLVMKGGITSGVIYPLAICRLAERYRLRSIGGASAGAIAAVTAGAAEYGRAGGDASKGIGFEGLAQLPAKLAESVGPAKTPRLLSLFQPTPAAKGAFEILLIAIEKIGTAKKLAAIAAVVLRNEKSAAALIVALAAAVGTLACAALSGSIGACVTAVLGALALLTVGLAVAAGVFALDTLQILGPDGRYGMCPGYTTDAEPPPDSPTGVPANDTNEPPLTEWLTGLLNDLAGVPRSKVITFGDLKSKGIRLELMTTDLTNGRPYRLPFGDSDRGKYFFCKSEWSELFPSSVVDVMVAGANARLAASRTATTSEERRLYDVWSSATATSSDYLPFPDADSLPLVVGARLSLSFPVLLQAIPLYSVDWTLQANQHGTPKLERCWFSDGGICSNLPIHFFDSLLPGRPTFALDLKAPHPDHPVQIPPFGPGHSERDNVWLPRNNTGGISASWNRFDRGPQKVPLLSFLATVVDTMQSWNDNLTMHYPGYRDRIVHISHTAEEGGLNLDMPPPVIQRLSNRGAAAGDALRARFDPASGEGWPNHLWVRYRTLLAMLDEAARSISTGLTGELRELFTTPPSYKFDSLAQTANAANVNTVLLDLAQRLSVPPSVSEDAPRPRAVLKGRPQSG